MTDQVDEPQGRASLSHGAREDSIALCLSGGGYRALFHLGALRRLNELGLLSQVQLVSSVSGGSILAGRGPGDGGRAGTHLPVLDWGEHGLGHPRGEATTGPILTGFAKGVLPWSIAKGFLATPGWKRRLLPRNWFLNSSTAVQEVAKRYERDLADLLLQILPRSPRFALCATEM